MSEDQIKEAARKYANQSQFKSDFPHDWNSVNDGFIQGMKLVLNLGNVSKRSELLIAFYKWTNGKELTGTDKVEIETFLDEYKSNL
jgi:hypothetical protein